MTGGVVFKKITRHLPKLLTS